MQKIETEKFSTLIYRLRYELGIKKSQMAELFEVDDKTYMGYETGISVPNSDQLLTLCSKIELDKRREVELHRMAWMSNPNQQVNLSVSKDHQDTAALLSIGWNKLSILELRSIQLILTGVIKYE